MAELSGRTDTGDVLIAAERVTYDMSPASADWLSLSERMYVRRHPEAVAGRVAAKLAISRLLGPPLTTAPSLLSAISVLPDLRRCLHPGGMCTLGHPLRVRLPCEWSGDVENRLSVSISHHRGVAFAAAALRKGTSDTTLPAGRRKEPDHDRG